MKVPRTQWQPLSLRPFLGLVALLAINACPAAAATVDCVAKTLGSDVARTLADADRYGIRFTPTALAKIDAQKEYCRSALISGPIDHDTPASLAAFLLNAPVLQRLYLNASGSDAKAGIAAGELIRARKLTTIAPLAVDHGSAPGVVLAQQDLAKLHDLCTSASNCSCRGVCVALWAGGANRQGNVLSFDGVSDPPLKSFVVGAELAEPLIVALEKPADGTPLNVLTVRANRNPPAIADSIAAICGVQPTQLNQQLGGNLVHFRNEIRRKEVAWRSCRGVLLVALAFTASPLLQP